LGLLLRHAEHNAGRGDVPELRDAHRDELGPEAEVQDRRREVAHRPEPGAWDASGAARRDEAAGVVHPFPELADADVEKLAVPEPGDRVQDAWFLQERCSARREQPGAAAALCRPDAVQSGEQSCAARAVQQAEQDAVQWA